MFAKASSFSPRNWSVLATIRSFSFRSISFVGGLFLLTLNLIPWKRIFYFTKRKNQIKEENNLSTVTTGEENQKTKGQQSESVTSERSDDINKPSEQLSDKPDDLESLKKQLEKERQAVKELQLRVSNLMGELMTPNDSKLDKLSSPCSVEKIAQIFQYDLFGDAWYEAFEGLKNNDIISKDLNNSQRSEEQYDAYLANALRRIFEQSYSFIEEIFNHQRKNPLKLTFVNGNLRKTTMSEDDSPHDKSIVDIVPGNNNDSNVKQIERLIQEYQERLSDENIKKFVKPFLEKHGESLSVYLKEPTIKPYIELCVLISCRICARAPLFVLNIPNDEFNPLLCRSINGSGLYIEQVIHPALCLSNGGQVLCRASVKVSNNKNNYIST